MQIANPIYDVVFKYLMDDSKIAKLLISTITGEKIISLNFLPQESVVELKHPSLTVYRLDFSAKIQTDDGYKNVLIEIQKAKLATDIMRFRKYLGEHYQNKENSYEVIVSGKKQRKAMPILSIYFLGHKLDHITVPLIRVNRQYYDITTGEELKEREEFIESLTHDSYVIQIPYLRKKYKTEVEQLLSVFDQSNVTSDHHILNVKEEDFPQKYRSIIRRLQRAISEPEVRKTMEIEDEILEELQDKEREIARNVQIIEEKDRTIEEKDRTIGEKDWMIEENKKTIQAKDKLIEELQKKLANR